MYQIIFTKETENGVEYIIIPVNPEDISLDKDNDNESLNVLGIGPIMQPRIPKLQVVKFSSFFPASWAPYVSIPDPKSPQDYIKFFRDAMDKKQIVSFAPAQTDQMGNQYAPDLSGFDCLVTSFSFEEKGGEPGDFYYDLELTEYRDYTPLKAEIQSNGNTNPAQAITQEQRSIPDGQLYVGAKVTANGNYYYTSAGAEPHGTANNIQCTISRINDGAAYPVHINNISGGALGWLKKDQVKVVSEK